MSDPRSLGGALLAAAWLSCATLSTAACKDGGKASEAKAVEHANHVAEVVATDVGEVERGLPEGARVMASLYADGADPQKDLPAVRRALRRVRAEVLDLTKAKSTFFALADARGVALRNDLEQDAMAGQDVVAAFPSLRRSLDGSFATTTGLFPTATPIAPPDRDWIAAAPVKLADGRVGGLLLTGWTFRRFANHLQEALRHDLQEELLKAKDTGKLPILYVAVFDPSGVYGAPLTPPVNEQALGALDLEAKTAAGPQHGVLTITERDFGWAAVRAPTLSPDAGVVVLRSEI